MGAASVKTGTVSMPDKQQAYVSACPVGCASQLTATDLVLPEGALLRCPTCGQLVSQVTAARYWETMEQFDRADFNQPTGGALARRQSVSRRRLRAIAALLGKDPATARLLDVGCSRGLFVEAAAHSGFRAEGVEPAPRLAAAAREAGLNVHTGLLEEQRFPAESFDAVTLFEVVEHLKDPRSLLSECHRILRPGGILLLSTGNTDSWTVSVVGARWDYFQIALDGGHISFFNPESIRQLAQACGFAVARIETSRVKFYEKGEVAAWRYAVTKFAAELLNYPARLFRKGHGMLAYLRRV